MLFMTRVELVSRISGIVVIVLGAALLAEQLIR
jgi:hypothetical protein